MLMHVLLLCRFQQTVKAAVILEAPTVNPAAISMATVRNYVILRSFEQKMSLFHGVGY